MRSPLPPTGRLDPTPDAAAAGAWKEVPRWGAEIQEALSDRRRACRSNVVRCDGLGRANKASHDDLAVWNGEGVADPEVRTGNRNRRCAGAGRQPPGRFDELTLAARERQEERSVRALMAGDTGRRRYDEPLVTRQ